MKIAIIEITTFGHYTLVESIAKIYASVAENEIVIFTTDEGKRALKGLENEQIKIVLATEKTETFFSRIKGFDKIFIPTLEAYSRVPFHIMKDFLKTDFNCPIYYIIHNVDFWFQQSFSDKIRNVFYRLSNFKDFFYRSKVYFKYVFINEAIVKKVKLSGGKFIALTESLGQHLSQHVENKDIAVIPFSIFDGQIKDKSSQNKQFRICIPGLLSTTRRDYDSVFEMMKKEEAYFKQKVTWDFLGGNPGNRESQDLIDKIQMHQKMGHDIRYYEELFLNMEDYDNNLACADIILGNMHLQQGANSTYGKSKETGIIFTMIKAAKVGLLPATYIADNALKSSTLRFKNYEETADILKKIIENPLEFAQLKARALENSEKFRPLSIYQRLEVL